MARTQPATKAPGNGVPRELDGAPLDSVPRGLAVAAAITWRVLLLAVAVIAVGYVAGKLLLDGNVLQPVLVGRKLELHPVVVLLSLTAGGVIAGLVGAFIAVPLAAVAGAVIDFARTS